MPKKEDMIIQALVKFESKIDSLDSRLDSVDKTLVKQEANLGEHMRRTALAEKSIDVVQQDLKPIKRHVAVMEGLLKGFGLFATLVSVLAGAVKIFSFLFH